jgi:hypothetical protein
VNSLHLDRPAQLAPSSIGKAGEAYGARTRSRFDSGTTASIQLATVEHYQLLNDLDGTIDAELPQ